MIINNILIICFISLSSAKCIFLWHYRHRTTLFSNRLIESEENGITKWWNNYSKNIEQDVTTDIIVNASSNAKLRKNYDEFTLTKFYYDLHDYNIDYSYTNDEKYDNIFNRITYDSYMRCDRKLFGIAQNKIQELYTYCSGKYLTSNYLTNVLYKKVQIINSVESSTTFDETLYLMINLEILIWLLIMSEM